MSVSFSRHLSCSTGRLLCHWDPTWSWGQLQLVAACHGPGNTILILTAARVLFLVAHNGDKQQRGSSAGAEPLSSNDGNFTQQQLQFQQQQVLEKYSVKVSCCRAVLVMLNICGALSSRDGSSGYTAALAVGQALPRLRAHCSNQHILAMHQRHQVVVR